MKWINIYLLSLACLFVHTSAHSMSFNYDKLGKGKKSKNAATCHVKASTDASAALSPLELFQSPFQMTYINWPNVIRLVSPKLAGKMDKGRSLIDRWVDMNVVDDDEIHKLNDNPIPDKDYKAKLSKLKAEKREMYRASLLLHR